MTILEHITGMIARGDYDGLVDVDDGCFCDASSIGRNCGRANIATCHLAKRRQHRVMDPCLPGVVWVPRMRGL